MQENIQIKHHSNYGRIPVLGGSKNDKFLIIHAQLYVSVPTNEKKNLFNQHF